MSNIVDNLYDDASSLGKIQSLIGLIFAIIIGLVLIVVGYYYVSSSKKYSLTNGIVKNAICEDKIRTNYNNKSSSISSTTTNTTKVCTLNIEYNVNNIVYINTLTTNNVYSINQSVQIEYLVSDPNQIRMPGLSDSTLGYISSAISLVLILGSGLNYYLSSNYKLYASAQGANTIYRTFT